VLTAKSNNCVLPLSLSPFLVVFGFKFYGSGLPSLKIWRFTSASLLGSFFFVSMPHCQSSFCFSGCRFQISMLVLKSVGVACTPSPPSLSVFPLGPPVALQPLRRTSLPQDLDFFAGSLLRSVGFLSRGQRVSLDLLGFRQNFRWSDLIFVWTPLYVPTVLVLATFSRAMREKSFFFSLIDS